MRTDSTAHQELIDTLEALRSGAHLERAPREERQRRVLAGRVFLLTLQLHWKACSEAPVRDPSSSSLPALGAL